MLPAGKQAVLTTHGSVLTNRSLHVGRSPLRLDVRGRAEAALVSREYYGTVYFSLAHARAEWRALIVS